MPNVLPTSDLLVADAAVIFAQQVRKRHARRTDVRSPARAEDIETALARLKIAMKPLRSAIGSFTYGPQTSIAEENRQTIREASLALQRESRKLHKMKAPTR